jgi:hypothetical protein
VALAAAAWFTRAISTIDGAVPAVRHYVSTHALTCCRHFSITFDENFCNVLMMEHRQS